MLAVQSPGVGEVLQCLECCPMKGGTGTLGCGIRSGVVLRQPAGVFRAHQCGSFVPASILRPRELSGSGHPAHSCTGASAMAKEGPRPHFTHKETGCHRGTAFSVTTCLAEGKAGTHAACHPTSGSSLRKQQPLCQSRKASRFPFCDFQCPCLGRDSSLGFEGQPGAEEQ